MTSISHKNLQELCRACLRTLKHNNLNTNENSITTAAASGGADSECDAGTSSLNSLLLPNLCKLFMFLTTYDVNKEYDDFPKRLCEWCYSRLMDYDEFRKLVESSTNILYEQWNKSRIEGSTIESGKEELKPSIQLLQNIKNEETIDEDDDDKLLLPELANMPLHIKPEPAFEAMDTQFILPSYLEEGELKREQMSYESYDTEEDADDEELLLSNGAANNSSPSISSTDGKIVMTKRDRDRKSLHCNACDKQFYKQVYLDAHVRGTHLGQEKPFQCSNCTKAFTRYNQLFLHIKSKHLEMLFRCDYENCDASFAVAIKLKMHRQVAHNSSEELVPQEYQGEEGEAGEHEQDPELELDHICYLCRRKYSSKRALREHIKRHKKIKEHVCTECGVAKVTRTELVTHMRTHTPNLEKFPCPQCPQVFNHKNAISRHVKVIHEGLKRFPCTYCPKRFGTRNSQVCHERLHTGERPFICEICHRGFVQPEGLRSHMKNHDKNLRKHVCKYCSQRFITLKNLVDHERRHLGDKPHICNICSKGFYSDADLRTHRSTHLEAAVGSNQDEISVYNESDTFS